MSSDSPIACTIEAGGMPARLAQIEAFGREAFLSAETGPQTATLRFVQSEENERRLAEIVAAESKCCAFMTFDETRDGNTQVLRIDTPEGGESMLRALAAALSAYSLVAR